jgi:hypothetical protein
VAAAEDDDDDAWTAVSPAHRAVSLHRLRRWSLGSSNSSAAAWRASNWGRSVHLRVQDVFETWALPLLVYRRDMIVIAGPSLQDVKDW